MKNNEVLKVICLVGIGFTLFFFLDYNFKGIKLWFDIYTQQGLLSYIITYFIVGIPIFIATILINNQLNFFKSLGLNSNILLAICISILFTMPLFIGGAIFFNFNKDIDIQKLIASTLVAGFMEELYFRGFLFGQLFKNTKIGFIPSLFFGALIFASEHLYQSQSVNELFGIFAVTFLGAFFFAWLFVEWNYNLWVPILTHTLMNFAWQIFNINSNALGNITANIFRGLTILLAIIFTVLYKKYKNKTLLITKNTLFINK
jgi:uncharacterized protein